VNIDTALVGNVKYRLGEREEARRRFTKAATLHEAEGNFVGHAGVVLGLASLQSGAGATSEAR
jgi:hypothetical protein